MILITITFLYIKARGSPARASPARRMSSPMSSLGRPFSVGRGFGKALEPSRLVAILISLLLLILRIWLVLLVIVLLVTILVAMCQNQRQRSLCSRRPHSCGLRSDALQRMLLATAWLVRCLTVCGCRVVGIGQTAVARCCEMCQDHCCERQCTALDVTLSVTETMRYCMTRAVLARCDMGWHMSHGYDTIL